MSQTELIDQIDALLPQTQCQACDYSACRPYAEAIVNGQATIDRCHPGGLDTLTEVAELLSVDPAPYLDTVLAQYRAPTRVRIDLDACIGCVKCINACPVDAIVGAPKKAHVVIDSLCTGCDLCIEPCPVDCIEQVSLDEVTDLLSHEMRDQSRLRYQAKQRRLELEKQKKTVNYANAKQKIQEMDLV